MAKQSIFGRISTLMRANINAILDSAEDPQKMLDQLVRDYTNSIADAESAIAETIGNLRLLERDHQEDVQSAAEWGNKAIAASRKADELRAAGSTADADKFDNLAKIALSARSAGARGEGRRADDRRADRGRRQAQGRPQRHEAEARRAEVEALRAARARQDRRGAEQGARRRQVDRRARPDERARPVRRQGPPPGGPRAGKQELAASTLDAQFESLDDVGELTEVEARLAALKAGGTLEVAIEASDASRRADAPQFARHGRSHVRAAPRHSAGLRTRRDRTRAG